MFIANNVSESMSSNFKCWNFVYIKLPRCWHCEFRKLSWNLCSNLSKANASPTARQIWRKLRCKIVKLKPSIVINRCLVLIINKSMDEIKTRSCKVHDQIYDLCLREIQREKVVIMKTVNRQFLSSRKLHKCWTGDEIYGFPYDVCRVLLTPSCHKFTEFWNELVLFYFRIIMF